MQAASLLTLAPRSRRDEDRPRFEQGMFVLRAEVQWLLSGPSEQIETARRKLDGVCELFAPDLLLLDFGNSVGRFDVPGLGPVEVESGKLRQRDFDRLLAELMEVATALPFQAGAAAALPYDRTVVVDENVLYHAFVYLRRVLSSNADQEDQLLPPLEAILRDPHRRFRRTRESVPVERAHRVDEASLVRLASGQDPLTWARGPAARIALAGYLRGYLPTSVQQACVESMLDTPENRFVKAFLAMGLAIIEDMRATVEVARRPAAFTARLVEECGQMARLLRAIEQRRMWSEIGSMVYVPASSMVLQRRLGYRDVYRHFARLHLAARVPLSRQLVWDLLETRDIAELYELWCFFKLAELTVGIIGEPRAARPTETGAFGLSVRRGLSLEWDDGTELHYNASYSRTGASGGRSYSLVLRPDVSLVVPSDRPNAGLHLLDAKFKVEDVEADLADNADSDEIARQERRGTFKHADLYKMHTYRDAIPRARSAWVLYPGSEARFFSEPEGRAITDFAGLPKQLEGVGVLPFGVAGDWRQGRLVLGKLLGAADWR